MEMSKLMLRFIGRVVSLNISVIERQMIQILQLELFFSLFRLFPEPVAFNLLFFYHLIMDLLDHFYNIIRKQFYRMSIDSDALLKKLRINTCISPLLQSSRLAQIKLAKSIYNNRHIRNISKFLRQQEEILRKSKQIHEQKRVVTEKCEKKGRYDENQLRELDYQFQSIKSKYVVDIDNKIYDYSGVNTNRRKDSIRKKPAEMSKLALIRKPTTFGHHSALPFGRMKSISISSHKQKESPGLKEPLSPLRLRNRVNNNNPESQEVKITLKQQEIMSALNNLVQLINTKQSQNHVIPRELIYSLIEKKYRLKQNETSSIFVSLLQPKPQAHPHHHVELPYCQFVSLKDSKKSIERIFNMNVKAAQRIAFKIYDRNDNGIIDEKDIIELFTVAEDFPAMQEDMEIIVKNYKINSALHLNQDQGVTRQRRNSKFPKRLTTLGQQSQFSLDKLNRIDEKAQPIQYESQKFNKQVFFTFKETKKQFFKKKTQSSAAIQLTWNDFQLAFKNGRPKIYYDLLDYLFNLKSTQIYDKANKLAYQQDKKSYRILVFNNSDGKSEVGSQSKLENEEEVLKKEKRSTRVGISDRQSKSTKSKALTSKKEKKQTSRAMNVQSLIGKVKSIDQFESVKYY